MNETGLAPAFSEERLGEILIRQALCFSPCLGCRFDSPRQLVFPYPVGIANRFAWRGLQHFQTTNEKVTNRMTPKIGRDEAES